MGHPSSVDGPVPLCYDEKQLSGRSDGCGCEMKQIRSKSNQDRKQLRAGLAGVFCAFLLCAALLSAFFLAAEAGHRDCTDARCPVCSVLQQCEAAVRKLGSGAAVPVLSAILVLFVLTALLYSAEALSVSTPVSRRVRLND